MAPIILLISPNRYATRRSPILEIIRNGKSLLINTLSTFKLAISALIPITPRILKILLPTTFPSEIALLPASDAVMDTAASGALVPIATIVNPTTIVETL